MDASDTGSNNSGGEGSRSPPRREPTRAAGRSAKRPQLLVAVRDSAATQVVRRELHLHPVARDDADVEFLHLSGWIRQDNGALVDLDAVLSAARLFHLALHFDAGFLLAHSTP